MATQTFMKPSRGKKKKRAVLPELADLPEPIDRVPIMLVGDSSSEYRAFIPK